MFDIPCSSAMHLVLIQDTRAEGSADWGGGGRGAAAEPTQNLLLEGARSSWAAVGAVPGLTAGPPPWAWVGFPKERVQAASVSHR